MAIRRRIPKDEESFDLLLQSLNAKCEVYKTALNISETQLTTLAQDAAAYHEWRLLKNQVASLKTSLTKIVETLFAGDKKAPLPVTPDLNLTAPAMPAKPGIEQRTREFIEYLELQDNFTEAIGLDLGFYVNVEDAAGSETRTGEFKTKDYTGYELDVIFSLRGAEAADLRWRVKGTTDWNKERMTKSPYRLQIPPDPNGLAITLEMQLIFVENNKPAGNWSDLKIVTARA